MGVLRAKVGGVWQDVGAVGTDEVQVGGTTPVDAAVELWYDTAAVPTIDAAKMPRGFVQRAVVTAPQTITTAGSWQDLTGLYIVWTALANRRYRISGKVPMQKLTAAGDLFLALWSNAPSQMEGSAVSVGINGYATLTVEFVIAPTIDTPVTHNLRLFLSNNGVATAVNTLNSAYLSIEDVGGV